MRLLQQLLVVLALGTMACGPGDTNAVLEPTYSEFEFAGDIVGFDRELRPLAVAKNDGDPLRIVRVNPDLTVTSLSEGLPSTSISAVATDPLGNLYVRTENQLWRRGVNDSMWAQEETPVRNRPVNEAVLFDFAVDGMGNAWVVVFEQKQPTGTYTQRIYQRAVETSTWLPMLEKPLNAAGTNPFRISLRKDGTLFVAQAGESTIAFAPGSTTGHPVLTCRTDIVDQACENARTAPVEATPFSNRAYVGLSPLTGSVAHPPFYVVDGPASSLTSRKITPPPQNGGTLTMMPTGDLLYYFVQSEPTGEPPYTIDRSVLFRVNVADGSFTRAGKIDAPFVQAATPARIYRIAWQLSGSRALPSKIAAWHW